MQRNARGAVETLLAYIRLVDDRNPAVCTSYVDANVVHKLTGKSGQPGVAACEATIAHTRVPLSLVHIGSVSLARNSAYVVAVMAARKTKMALLFRMVSQGDRYVIDSTTALLPKRRR